MQGVTPDQTFVIDTPLGEMLFHYLSARQYMQAMSHLRDAEKFTDEQHIAALVAMIRLGLSTPDIAEQLPDRLTFSALADLATEMIHRNRVEADSAKKSAPPSPTSTDATLTAATAVQTLG